MFKNLCNYHFYLLFHQEDESFLDVGDNNDIREYVSIHRSSKSSDKTVSVLLGYVTILHITYY